MTELERESKRFAGNVGKCAHYFTKRIDTRQIPPTWYICKKCNEYSMDGVNPAYTIELIRAELERVGKWDGLVDWHDFQFRTTHMTPQYDGEWIDSDIKNNANADILTTPLLLLQAANGYLYECKLIKREEK